MPAKDIYHEQVKSALVNDGWVVTHDPYTIAFGQRNIFVDFGAERMLAAEKGNQKIAVEIKSFQGASDIRDLEQAIGQYVFYRSLLNRFEVERKLYLAVPYAVLIGILEEAIARPVLEDEQVAIIAFDAEKERIIQWSR
ncbi:MAG: hypothetical protein DWI57_00890 [Chloroflexi bacterium]|nr:MAG: hypothetical protein DWI57_00890 [Chloroflexota bacterium]